MEDRRVFQNGAELATEAAKWICTLAQASRGRFAICCSGGSTPKRLYQSLASQEIAVRFPWERVHWFWGDERFVPPNHLDSNYRMTRDTLLARVPVPDSNIHPIPTVGMPPAQAATDYQRTLQEFYGADRLVAGRPLFDVMLLGIGEDGHTASLFPGHPVLDETEAWAVAVVGAQSEARISLTYPVLDSCREAVFLATGEGKRAAVARAQAKDRTIPAGRISPSGRLHWFTDIAAASPD